MSEDLKKKADRIYQEISKDDIKIGSIIKYNGNTGKVKEINHEGVKRFAKVDFDRNSKKLKILGEAGINTKDLEKTEPKKVKARRKLFRPGEILVRSSDDDFKIHKVIKRKSRETFVTEAFDKTGKFLGTSIRKYSELKDDNLVKRISNMDVNSVSKIVSDMAEYRLNNAMNLLDNLNKENLEKLKEIYKEQDMNPSRIKTLLRGLKQSRDKEDLQVIVDAEKEKLKDIMEEREKGKGVPKKEKPSAVEL